VFFIIGDYKMPKKEGLFIHKSSALKILEYMEDSRIKLTAEELGLLMRATFEYHLIGKYSYLKLPDHLRILFELYFNKK